MRSRRAKGWVRTPKKKARVDPHKDYHDKRRRAAKAALVALLVWLHRCEADHHYEYTRVFEQNMNPFEVVLTGFMKYLQGRSKALKASYLHHNLRVMMRKDRELASELRLVAIHLKAIGRIKRDGRGT